MLIKFKCNNNEPMLYIFQGYKTKVLVTEINNRHLNNNTKYEVCLFIVIKMCIILFIIFL